MTSKTIFKAALFILVGWLAGEACAAGALEHGHVRANVRAWHFPDSGENGTEDVEYYEEEEMPAEEEAPVTVEIEAFHVDKGRVKKRDKSEGPGVVTRVKKGVRKGAKLVLIGISKKPNLRNGYLTVDVPPALRFSDFDPVNSRPPSPALPEFNFVSNEYVPYLIESALPEDAMNDLAQLSEIVIELEPHEIVSGKIDTRRTTQEELVEHFDLDEQRTTVLRPEEVLIFFETDTNTGKTGALVPFSPATPSATTIKSSATLNKE